VLGLILSAREDDTVYLRGVEEACHHSLVLKKAERPSCARLGMRVLTETDLDQAKVFFDAHGSQTRWAEVPRQGRTLHVDDPFRVPLELCATMPAMPRMLSAFPLFRGGRALRIDHFQVLTPHVREACALYMKAGFRLSEYISPMGEFEPAGVFLQRKGNPYDIVFFNGVGPRLHHFAYLASEVHNIIHACDVAGSLDHGASVERGPGRHGPGHAMFVYFRDPDGHRVELFNTHYQTMDMENEPVRWEPGDNRISYPWGLPAQRKWFEQASEFTGVKPFAPLQPSKPVTLESYLSERDYTQT
jgi:catechol 2,3-dioxygenase